MAVQAHLQTATAAASVAAQAAGDSPSPVPLIDFRDAWKATDGFSKSCASNLERLTPGRCFPRHTTAALPRASSIAGCCNPCWHQCVVSL